MYSVSSPSQKTKLKHAPPLLLSYVLAWVSPMLPSSCYLQFQYNQPLRTLTGIVLKIMVVYKEYQQEVGLIKQFGGSWFCPFYGELSWGKTSLPALLQLFAKF